jgi:signal transduction histidine kinase
MHDDLGAQLTEIAILSEMTRRGGLPPERMQGSMSQISAAAQCAIDKISEVVWAINPQNDTLDSLLAYIHAYAAERFDLANINYHIDFPQEVPALVVSAELRQTVFMAMKEALSNLLKHAGATHARLQASIDGRQVTITLRDNGKGFDPATVTATSHGLRHMRQRIQSVRGSCTVQSAPGQGTQTTLIFSVLD